MDFALTEDQELLARTAASFAQKESPIERFRRLREGEIGWDPAVWKQMGELGWLAVVFPEEAGGLGGGLLELGLVLGELGKTLVPEPILASVTAGLAVAAGDAAQRARFLAPMMAGDRTLSLAWSEEGGRFDPARIETRVERHGAGCRITGEKTFALDAHHADHLVVSARNGDGVSLLVVDRNADGLTVTPIRLMDGHRAAHVRLDGVEVPGDRLIGEPGRALPVLERALDAGAALAVAEGHGLCEAVLRMTVDYLKTREQFGKKIGAFQTLQHRAVEMFVETELVRSAAILALVEASHPDPAVRQAAVSAAQIQLSIGGKRVTRQAIQLHGGVGVTDEHDVGLYFKRIHTLFTVFGDEERHAERLAARPGFEESAGL